MDTAKKTEAVQHTKTPWNHVEHEGDNFITLYSEETNDRICAISDYNGRPNAAFIVRACNAHDLMYAALKDFANGACCGSIKSDFDETFANLLRKVDEALKAADGAA